MSSMIHRGRIALIDCDERDNRFAGRLLGIRAIISAHAQSVADLRAEFQKTGLSLLVPRDAAVPLAAHPPQRV